MDLFLGDRSCRPYRSPDHPKAAWGPHSWELAPNTRMTWVEVNGFDPVNGGLQDLGGWYLVGRNPIEHRQGADQPWSSPVHRFSVSSTREY